MKTKRNDFKKLCIQWGVLFSILFCICIILMLCNMYIMPNNDKKIPTQKYVEINGKAYNYNTFNLYLSGQSSSDENDIVDAKKVKSLIYIGEGNEVNDKIFGLFPNVKCMRISNCTITDVPLPENLSNLMDLELSNCVINNNVTLQSYSIKELTLDHSEVSKLRVDLPQLKVLIMNYMDLTQPFLDSFDSCTNIERISLIGSTLDSIELLDQFKNISALRLLKTETTGYDKLNKFSQLNEVYLDDWVDRKNINFMYSHFKNGDMTTRAYFINKKYKLDSKRM